MASLAETAPLGNGLACGRISMDIGIPLVSKIGKTNIARAPNATDEALTTP